MEIFSLVFWLMIAVLAVTAVFYVLVFVFFSREIKSTREKDPAAQSCAEIIFLYPGLQAVIMHRIAHVIWRMKIPFLPRAVSQFSRWLTGIEIHPGAEIGQGLFIDHGMGVVIGETSVVGDNVTLFQGVTLGGTGKEKGKRHPTVGSNVVIGAGAKVLGNITIGDNSYVGANAVVLKDVPANSTVVGVPGHVTKQEGKRIDLMLDHTHVSDPMMQHMKDLLKRIIALEEKSKDKR